MFVTTTINLTTASGNSFPTDGFINVYMTQNGIRSGTSQFNTAEDAKRHITKKDGIEYLGTIRISDYLSNINADYVKALIIKMLDRRLAHLVGKPELLDPAPTQDTRKLAKRNVAKATRPRELYEVCDAKGKTIGTVKARTASEAVSVWNRKYGHK